MMEGKQQKILIQKRKCESDTQANEIETWEDYYRPYAEINTNMGAADWDCQSKGYERTIGVLIKYCRQAAEIEPVNFRFIYKGKVYDVLSADNVNEQNEKIRIKGGLKL